MDCSPYSNCDGYEEVYLPTATPKGNDEGIIICIFFSYSCWLVCDDLLCCKIYLLVVYVFMARARYLNMCLHTNLLFLDYYTELGLEENMVGFARVLHSMYFPSYHFWVGACAISMAILFGCLHC